LSSLSPIVKALTGSNYGDQRFYFPKEMLTLDSLFSSTKEEFQSYITNEHLTLTKDNSHS
ncbi:TPA: phosphohydrolase, partial [Streptococcus agalactiae]